MLYFYLKYELHSQFVPNQRLVLFLEKERVIQLVLSWNPKINYSFRERTIFNIILNSLHPVSPITKLLEKQANAMFEKVLEVLLNRLVPNPELLLLTSNLIFNMISEFTRVPLLSYVARDVRLK
jgi:hypothetical protein